MELTKEMVLELVNTDKVLLIDNLAHWLAEEKESKDFWFKSYMEVKDENESLKRQLAQLGETND